MMLSICIHISLKKVCWVFWWINIEGGSVVLGLDTSGTALSLMMAPKFVHHDYAKLLAKYDER